MKITTVAAIKVTHDLCKFLMPQEKVEKKLQDQGKFMGRIYSVERVINRVLSKTTNIQEANFNDMAECIHYHYFTSVEKETLSSCIKTVLMALVNTDIWTMPSELIPFILQNLTPSQINQVKHLLVETDAVHFTNKDLITE